MVARSWRSHTQRTPPGGNESPLLGSFVRDARLAPGGLLDGEGDDHVLQFTPDPFRDRVALAKEKQIA